MRVNVGDIVLIKYRDFNDERVIGLFAVIYHDSLDDYNSDNFTAIKVSSNEQLYGLPLLKSYLPFLERDSYMNCNQFFRFREPSVVTIVGRLTPYYLNKALVQIKSHVIRIEKGIENIIGKENMFENTL